MSHGEIKVVDHEGYSLYVCADCGQNINKPSCPARRSTQPNPPTFDSLLSDPTQQLDTEGIGLTILEQTRVTPPAGGTDE